MITFKKRPISGLASKTFNQICLLFLIFALSSVSVYADSWRALDSGSGRAQWQPDGGYCGSLAIQKIMLKYGIWISQQEARASGGGELLLYYENNQYNNYEDALDNLSINHNTYYSSTDDAEDHLQKIRTALAAGYDYVIGARTNLSWSYGDDEYEHIFAIHAIEGTSSGYRGSNTIKFNDSYPEGDNTPDLSEDSCTWAQFNGEDNGCDYYIDDEDQFGEVITGVDGYSGKVKLNVDSLSEPGYPYGSSSSMDGSLDLTGLTDGNSYTIKKWEGTWSNYDGFSTSGFTNIHTFTASGTTYSYDVSWIGGIIAIFDLVDNGSGSSSGSPRTNQSITAGEWEYYTVEVPSGTASLTVTTAGSTGDADLCIKYGSQPTSISDSAQDSQGSNSNESVTQTNPTAGTWHIGVLAYNTGGNITGLTVEAEYE